MASRQLRKLRQQQDLLKFQPAAEEAHKSEEDGLQPPVTQHKNVFSAFAALGDDGSDDDDNDRALQELKLVDSKKEASTTAHSTTTTAVDQLRALLRINFHHLKAMNEMRKLFGKTIEAAESESTPQAGRQRARAQDVNLET